MITQKPKQFYLVYDTGVRGEFCDPITGKPWYRLKWTAIKKSMAQLAAVGDVRVTLINDRTGNSITVTPEGRWI